MTNPPTTQQKAAEARRDARALVRSLCPSDHHRIGEEGGALCGPVMRAIDRALALARLEVAEGMHAQACLCHRDFRSEAHGVLRQNDTKHDDPYVDPRCAAERDRLRRECQEAER